MAAATVTSLWREALAEEVVLLEVSDGETYTSSLSKPLVAIATAQADDDGEINCVISGRTITINAAGMSDKAIALVVKGRL